ncbi:MAG: SAM hydrolase/SAM-dependent halogenase family protein [Candidatus Eiseniibacteriota bacterium]
MNSPLITFVSDFGLDDWFAGVVHGVLLERCPQARIVDLTHAIPPGDIARAAFVLEAAAPDFPPGTVHLAVVDPGVGTERRAIAVHARGQWFVGPDNGVLEWALSDPAAVVHELRGDRFFRLPLSRTFHGRDVFAPVAAALANGTRGDELGPRLAQPVRLANPRARLAPAEGATPAGASGEPAPPRLMGVIAYVDRFGNALTNIDEGAIVAAFPQAREDDLEVHAGGRVIHGLSRSYGDAPVGTVVALIGSSGRLEVAQVGGAADVRLGLGAGDEVWITLRR